MILLEESSDLKKLNEMFIKTLPSLPIDIENSIYYTKIRQLLHPEIFNFCKEQLDLKEDLNILRMSIGEPMVEEEIRSYLDTLKEKYSKVQNVGLEYSIEITRIDFGVPVFCVIKRGGEIYIKKFVYRFRKANQSTGLDDLSNAQIINNSLKSDKNKREEKFNKLLGGK